MEQIYSVSSFVAAVNQIFEHAFTQVVVEGEVSEFRISKNRWVYFKLKDEESSINVFCTVYQLNTPIEDGMTIQVKGTPKLHHLYGFSLNLFSFKLKGEGTIKKSLQLLKKKLEKEGLFADERKRPVPELPKHIAVVSSTQAAGYKDFTTVLTQRWPLFHIKTANVSVQGERAPEQIVKAIEHINLYQAESEVIVLIRGGGSEEDLMAFSDERVVRAVATSKTPVVVGVGHERDTSLADLAADLRAATPTDAARLILPDKQDVINQIDSQKKHLSNKLSRILESNKRLVQNQLQQMQNFAIFKINEVSSQQVQLNKLISTQLGRLHEKLDYSIATLQNLDPSRILRLGYSIVKSGNKLISSVEDVDVGDKIKVKLSKGTIKAEVENVEG